MIKLRSRLLRHFSYANLMASIAVFVALGGVGYAATSISGNKLVKQSVGAGKLKKGTLTSTQVKQNGLDGSVIDESTLSIVPSAVSATTASSATTAGSATTATTAEHAEIADVAESLDGVNAKELLVTCPPETELYGGMCWDEAVRDAGDWIDATSECGDAGGRLPSLSELIAYVLQPGTQVAAHNWSADVVDLVGGKEHVLTSNETATSSAESSPTQLGYRCLFYRTN